MRVLLLGARGMLGEELSSAVPAAMELMGPTLPRVDVTDPVALAALIDAQQPDWVMNATGYTRVDDAEHDFDGAMAVNAHAVGALGGICAARGVGVLHYSSDYIFPGSGATAYDELAPPDPVNRYGESKLAGERALLASGAHALIVRTQWLFGRYGRSFPRTMWERATAGTSTRVVTDQIGRPTFALDLADASWRLLSLGAEGVYHVANSGTASWFDVAQQVFLATGRPELLTPCTSDELALAARRPRHSVLATDRARDTLGGDLPHWSDALSRFLAQLRGETATAAK